MHITVLLHCNGKQSRVSACSSLDAVGLCRQGTRQAKLGLNLLVRRRFLLLPRKGSEARLPQKINTNHHARHGTPWLAGITVQARAVSELRWTHLLSRLAPCHVAAVITIIPSPPPAGAITTRNRACSVCSQRVDVRLVQ